MAAKYEIHPMEKRMREGERARAEGRGDRHAETCAAMVAAQSGAELVACDCGYDERWEAIRGD